MSTSTHPQWTSESKAVNIPTKQLEGQDHYVVPMVMLKVGVFAGSNGPVLYTADALRASVPYWNAKPIVVYHPSMAGSGFAGNPEVYNNQKVGTVFNARFDGTRLTADAWLNVSRLAAVDTRITNALRAGRMMEVSTGLSFDNATGGGVWQGQTYNAAAYSMTPDHLAILPDRRGACSIADGAGLLRNEGAINAVNYAHAADYAAEIALSATRTGQNNRRHRRTAQAVCNDDGGLPIPDWSRR